MDAMTFAHSESGAGFFSGKGEAGECIGSKKISALPTGDDGGQLVVIAFAGIAEGKVDRVLTFAIDCKLPPRSAAGHDRAQGRPAPVSSVGRNRQPVPNQLA